MRRKICVVTGSRAEFGLLRWLMSEIKADESLELQVVATAAHLSPEYGLTYREIEDAGFGIDVKVEMLLSADTATAIAKSMGLGLIGFADAFARLHPDIVLVLGDRFEILSAVTAAFIAKIPVAHLHGGETTEGAFDEGIRHAVTKMSHLHFVAAEEYRLRVIQMGEAPNRVFHVGGLGVDNIKKIKLLEKHELESSIGFKFGDKNLLVTFHPVTLDSISSSVQMKDLLSALSELRDTNLIFTMPNADTGNRELVALVEDFVKINKNARAYMSLGVLRYLSCMKYVDGVVGNSSSGLAEAPSMGIGTINIGDRQKGRLAACSVIHCSPKLDDIRIALRRLYEPSFKETLRKTINPYGTGGASAAITKTLKDFPLSNILKKSFHNLDFPIIPPLGKE